MIIHGFLEDQVGEEARACPRVRLMQHGTILPRPLQWLPPGAPLLSPPRHPYPGFHKGVFHAMLVPSPSPSRKQESCKIDSDCADNYFCYSVSNVCAPCKKDFCRRINRVDSYRNCHKEFSDCGQCLPGYEEEILTGGSPRGACIPSSPHALSLPPTPAMRVEEQMDPLFGSWLLLGVIGILLSALVLLLYLQIKRNVCPRPSERSADKSEAVPLTERPGHPTLSAPPPYNPTSPPSYDTHPPESRAMTSDVKTRVEVHILPVSRHSSASSHSSSSQHQVMKRGSEEASASGSGIANTEILRQKNSSDCDAPTETLQLVPCEMLDNERNSRKKAENATQQAAVFRKPEYEEEIVQEVLQEDEQDELLSNDEDNLSDTGSSSFTDNDEATQPCTWTPDPLQRGGDERDETSGGEAEQEPAERELGEGGPPSIAIKRLSSELALDPSSTQEETSDTREEGAGGKSSSTSEPKKKQQRTSSYPPGEESSQDTHSSASTAQDSAPFSRFRRDDSD